MTTPHISAVPGAFAPVVIMPDDPLQARYISDGFLESVKEITAVRNMLGFTGLYRGVPVSVMGSGMGIPSTSIYARELFVDYGVEVIVSIGECYALHQRVSVRDLVLASGASTFSGVNRIRFAGGDFSAVADFELLCLAWQLAEEKSVPVRVGNVCTADIFLADGEDMEQGCLRGMLRMGILGADMNSAGLYGVAAECGRKALSVCAVNDHIEGSGRVLSSDDRENSFRRAVQLVLGIVELYGSNQRKSH
ncbi:purine-nucleoside phosphorylase [Parendozoicomonas sp. Alg238-R29]|uniref:purine-nucleoside phosphorylase n=1 Tax=Parendozoicomonas sp. Alg238-R29 TaxID=2993446 RepID=UPI00248DD3D5|nr:purine-nucleoside phosphorylase [Parendozoicomonas sp. Alg238-R29]